MSNNRGSDHGVFYTGPSRMGLLSKRNVDARKGGLKRTEAVTEKPQPVGVSKLTAKSR